MSRPRLEAPNYRLFQRVNGWWYVGWSENRRSHRKALRTRDSNEARRLFARFLEDPIPDAPTIADILDGYLADRRPVVADPVRLDELAKPLRRFFGPLLPDQATRAATRTYTRERKVAPGTLRRELGGLRAALRWAAREGWIDTAPYIELPAPPAPQERWLTRKEAALLLDACAAPHLRLFVLLALHTGARSGAILDLTWDRADLEAGRIDFGAGRGKKRRAVVPISATLAAELETARELGTCDRVIEYGGKPVASVKKAFGRACARASLEDVTPHVLRHTAATWAALAGVPLAKIARMLGQQESTTERVYAKHTPDYLREVADALEGKGSGKGQGFARQLARK
jgi:integrase